MSVSIFAPRPPSVQADVGLLAELRQRGFQDGPPPHLEEWALRIDAGLVRRMKCSRCKVPSLRCHFLHRSRQYRCVGVCTRCSHGEEV